MPLISKCHFEEEFKDVLKYIEEQFDADFENGIFYHLEGLDYESLIGTLTFYRDSIMGGTWDLFMTRTHSPVTETYIKDFIVTLLYLLKKVKEKNEEVITSA